MVKQRPSLRRLAGRADSRSLERPNWPRKRPGTA